MALARLVPSCPWQRGMGTCSWQPSKGSCSQTEILRPRSPCLPWQRQRRPLLCLRPAQSRLGPQPPCASLQACRERGRAQGTYRGGGGGATELVGAGGGFLIQLFPSNWEHYQTSFQDTTWFRDEAGLKCHSFVHFKTGGRCPKRPQERGWQDPKRLPLPPPP